MDVDVDVVVVVVVHVHVRKRHVRTHLVPRPLHIRVPPRLKVVHHQVQRPLARPGDDGDVAVLHQPVLRIERFVRFAGVAGDLIVTAYQSASGLVNLVTPTSAVVMGGLAIARVGYNVWLRFVWPILALLFLLTVIMLSIGAVIG